MYLYTNLSLPQTKKIINQYHNFVIPLEPTFSLRMISISLPGVAHNILQPCTICRMECPNWVPPYIATALTQVLLTIKVNVAF